MWYFMFPLQNHHGLLLYIHDSFANDIFNALGVARRDY